jgi:lipoprotein-anchoring transpeptidase ErfK/SrfK
MQRLAFPSLLATVLTCGTAFAGPLNLQPSTSANASSMGAVFAAPPPAEPPPVRTAAAQNYGGGFLEMLFRGPGGPPPDQRSYQSGSDRTYQPESGPMMAPSYRQSRPEAIDPDYDRMGSGMPSSATRRSGLDPRFEPQEVPYNGSERSGTIIINTRERLLYLVQDNGRAMRYGIGVGRPGFTWAGSHRITNMREWPDWTPPPEMIRRQPHLPRHMPGGPNNPLGARAMYLGSTLYRIHGSNEPWTIGHAVSSGCIRMRNEDVIDLYRRVHVGTRVVVI